MAFDETVADRVRTALARRRGLAEKKMFGGLAFLVHGNMACGVIGDDLVLRVGADGADRLLRSQHVRPMDFTGRPLTGYVYVAPGGYRRAADLRRLVDQAVTFARTLPKK